MLVYKNIFFNFCFMKLENLLTKNYNQNFVIFFGFFCYQFSFWIHMKYHKSATLQFQKFQFFGFDNNCFSFFIFAVNEEGGSVFIQIFVLIH